MVRVSGSGEAAEARGEKARGGEEVRGEEARGGEARPNWLSAPLNF